MIYVSGTARIRHAETGKVYEIDSSLLHFEPVRSEERGMGPEITYEAYFEHPELGTLTWTLLEYPVGIENYRDTDIGPNELLENIDFGLKHVKEQTTPRQFDEEEREAKIDELVEWFHSNYEDPAENTPYETREGGYQWIWGGPYDALEELSDKFGGDFDNEDEADDIIGAAVEQIEADGIYDWSGIPSDDRDDDGYTESIFDPSQVEGWTDLKDLIAGIPEPHSDPVFRFGDDGRLYIGTPPDLKNVEKEDDLLSELRSSTEELVKALDGTNAFQSILRSSVGYKEVLFGKSQSVSRIYARGVRLANAVSATRKQIESGDLPPFPLEIDEPLNSVLELHSAYIMAQDEGRVLVQGAMAFQRPASVVAELKLGATKFAEAIYQTPDLFNADIRENARIAADEVGAGPHPERSTQTSVSFFGSLISTLLKGGARQFWGAAFFASVPGAAAVSTGAAGINAAWAFLAENFSILTVFASFAIGDLSWMYAVPYILGQIRAALGKKTTDQTL